MEPSDEMKRYAARGLLPLLEFKSLEAARPIDAKMIAEAVTELVSGPLNGPIGDNLAKFERAAAKEKAAQSYQPPRGSADEIIGAKEPARTEEERHRRQIQATARLNMQGEVREVSRRGL